MNGYNPYYYDPASAGEVAAGSLAGGAGALGSSGGNVPLAAASFAIGQAGNWIKSSKEAKKYSNWSPYIDNLQTDSYGKPIYNLGDEYKAIQDYDPSKAGKDLPMRGLPFGLVGAGIGLLQRKKRRKEAREAKNEAVTRFSQQRDKFNDANMAYAQRQAVMSGYNQDRYNTNLFGIPQGI